MACEALREALVQCARGRRARAPSTRTGQPAERAHRGALQLRDRLPGRCDRPPARAGCAGCRSGWMRAAACGSSRASSACSAGQPSRGRARIDPCAQLRRSLRQRRKPAQQRAQVEHGAADQQRHPPARADLAHRRRARRRRNVRPSSSPPGRRCRSGGAARARAAARAGLAVPMSMPRYTMRRVHADDLDRRTPRRARPPSRVLPEPVGPVSTSTGSREPASAPATQRPRRNSWSSCCEASGASRSGGRGCTGWRARCAPSAAAARSSPAASGAGARGSRCGRRACRGTGRRRRRGGARRRRAPGRCTSVAHDCADLARVEHRRHPAQREARRPERVHLEAGPLPLGTSSSSRRELVRLAAR